MFGNPDYYNIEQLKEAGMWPYPFLSGHGMLPYLKRAGQDILGVEVGVLKGENVHFLLETLPNIKKIWGVDHYEPHTDYDTVRTKEDMEQFKEIATKNLEQFGERYELLQGNSLEVAKTFETEKLDFILLDADHTPEGIKSDLTAWYPALKKGGHIFVHDTHVAAVFEAITEWRNENRVRSPQHKSKNFVDFWVK